MAIRDVVLDARTIRMRVARFDKKL